MIRHSINFIFASSIILALLSTHARASFATAEQSWHFNVFLDDTPIGYHLFQLKQKDETQQIFIKAEFDVKFLFFSVYSYLHENAEIWTGGCLQELSSSTEDNGDNNFVKLQTYGNDYRIETSEGVNTSTGCLRSFAYWNPELLKTSQLVNAQTGEIIPVEFIYIGLENFSQNNQIIESNHYRLQGDEIEIDLWYTTNNQWLALHSKLENGRSLRYELRQEFMP